MKIIKRLLFLIVMAVVILLAGYEFGYREKSENFFKEDIKQVYINRDLKKHDYSMIEKYLRETGREDLINNMKRTQNVLKGLYIFSYGRIEENMEREIVVVDTGLAYPILRTKLTDYFTEDGEYYLLKEERKPKELTGVDIYLKPYRGYFVLGVSKNLIEGFLGARKSSDSNLVTLDKDSREGALGKVVMDLTGDKFFEGLGITGTVAGGDLNKDMLSIYNEFYGSGDFIDSLKDQPEERRYTTYAGRDRIYISGNNIGGSVTMALRSMDSRELETLNMIFSMLGVKVEDVFNQIDGEAVMDMNSNSWMIPLKDTRAIKKIFKFFGQEGKVLYGDRELVLDGNLLKSGRVDEGTEKVKIAKEDFLYGDLSMDIFNSIFSDKARGKLTGKTSEKGVVVELELNAEATKDLFEETLK